MEIKEKGKVADLTMETGIINDTEKEIKDLVTKVLERKGFLNKIQAEIRAGVFLAMEEEEDKLKFSDSIVNDKLTALSKNSEGNLSIALVREFLDYYKLEYCKSVFDPELRACCGYEFSGREDVATALGVNAEEDLPLLQLIINRFMKNKESDINDRNVTEYSFCSEDHNDLETLSNIEKFDNNELSIDELIKLRIREMDELKRRLIKRKVNIKTDLEPLPNISNLSHEIKLLDEDTITEEDFPNKNQSDKNNSKKKKSREMRNDIGEKDKRTAIKTDDAKDSKVSTLNADSSKSPRDVIKPFRVDTKKLSCLLSYEAESAEDIEKYDEDRSLSLTISKGMDHNKSDDILASTSSDMNPCRPKDKSSLRDMENFFKGMTQMLENGYANTVYETVRCRKMAVSDSFGLDDGCAVITDSDSQISPVSSLSKDNISFETTVSNDHGQADYSEEISA